MATIVSEPIDRIAAVYFDRVEATMKASGCPGSTQTSAAAASARARRTTKALQVQNILVSKIRTEEGLGRKRDRNGHRELRQSIEQFGVLTPITVRPARDDTGDYLLIKGQGRTLACRMLGFDTIPAIVLDEDSAGDEKVQQFLVENVARLRMRAVDRALLISRARKHGEETAQVARRFGVTPATVRRLEAQLDGASKTEVAVLRSGTVNLALHAVIAKHVPTDERSDIVAEIANHSLRTREVDELFRALGWKRLADLGSEYRASRLLLISWACRELSRLDKGTVAERLNQLAEEMPLTLDTPPGLQAAIPQ